jgi:hypothetical protein
LDVLDVYEVRADGRGVIYRVLFAPQGKNKQVLLSRGLQEEDPEDACGNDPSGEAPAEGLGAPGWVAQFGTASYLSFKMLI